jgi:outer membrane protein assembly factor BamE (lipoprotein component of BamABCDE complex)
LKHREGRELSFEVLRMLSVGMTKVEVLSRAGAPHYTLRQFGSSAWVYSSTDHWIVELTFAAGKVIAINWSRP